MSFKRAGASAIVSYFALDIVRKLKNKGYKKIITEIYDLFPILKEKRNQLVGELSGGQRQRLAIARALLKDAPLLILDEATSALDSESEKLIQQAIDNLKIGKTTIVIAHRLSTVEKAENIIVLKNGAIVESGSHEDLMNQGETYFELYKNQFKDEKEPEYLRKTPILKSEFSMSEYRTSNFIEEAWYENKNWIKIFIPLSWLYRFIFKIKRSH